MAAIAKSGAMVIVKSAALGDEQINALVQIDRETKRANGKVFCGIRPLRKKLRIG
jgi:hypothetical protein